MPPQIRREYCFSAIASIADIEYILLVMPTYDYECRACGYSFETFQSMSDVPLTECPECRKVKLRRLIGGGSGIIFKGSGFYVNDSRKDASTPLKSTGDSSPAKSAEASDTKATA